MASRIFVQESIVDEFTSRLKGAIEAASQSGVIGDPLNKSTQVGPLADQAQFKRVMEFLEIGKRDGELVTGGVRRGQTGLFVEPTVFRNLPSDSRIVREEVFGPVVTVQPFKTEEEAINLANDTIFGLSGKYEPGVFRHRAPTPERWLSPVFLTLRPSLPLLQLHQPCPPRVTRDRGRHRRHQRLVFPGSRHALWWYQAVRLWQGGWSGGTE